MVPYGVDKGGAAGGDEAYSIVALGNHAIELVRPYLVVQLAAEVETRHTCITSA